MTRTEIIAKVHADRETFEKQCRIFAAAVEGYAERLIQSFGQYRDPEQSLGPEFVWDGNDADRFSCLAWETVGSIWCPHWQRADDSNPLLWFATAQERRPGAYVSLGRAPADQPSHDHVLLAIAHDCDPSMSGADPRIFGDVERGEHWERDKFFRVVDNALILDGGESRLQRAWGRVEGKLQVRPPAGSQDEYSPQLDSSPYVELDLAERTLTVGTKKISPSDRVFEYLKELAFARKADYQSPQCSKWKSAHDTLRRQIGSDLLPRVAMSNNGRYTLSDTVRIQGGGQVGIRRTKQSR